MSSLFALFTAAALAGSTATVDVTLSDGQTLRGVAEADARADDAEIVLVLTNGTTMTLDGAQVEAIDPVEYTPGGFENDHPAAGRYLYAPSAIPLEKGQCFVSQKELLFTSAGVAVSDHLTLVVGSVLPALFFGADGLNGIVGFKTGWSAGDRVHVGFGGEAFGVAEVGVLGLGYANVTLGDTDGNVTLASGIAGGFGGDGVGVPVTLAAMKRTSERWFLVTENWLLIDASGDALVAASAALRFLPGGGRFALDIGFIGTAVIDNGTLDATPVPIPWLDLTWYFDV
jgi:hypothetical protein